MRLDTLSERDVIADYRSIRSSKTGVRAIRLQRVEHFVLRRFMEFGLLCGDLERLLPLRWSKETKDALLHCYESETKAWLVVKEVTINPSDPYAQLVCPYCLMRQPKSIDHFLPKEIFPEFSTFSPNLVFVCDPCNRKKGTRFVGTPREVLNPYFDNIPDDIALLSARIELVRNTPRLTYSVGQNVGEIPDELRELAQRHFLAFELEADLLREGSSYIATIVNELVSRFDAPISREVFMRECLLKEDGLNEHSINSWRLAILEGLRFCNGFADYINLKIRNKLDQPTKARRRASSSNLSDAARAVVRS